MKGKWDSYLVKKKKTISKKGQRIQKKKKCRCPEGVWSGLPPSHPPEESPSALKSKTCINDLHRAGGSHTHRAKRVSIGSITF